MFTNRIHPKDIGACARLSVQQSNGLAAYCIAKRAQQGPYFKPRVGIFHPVLLMRPHRLKRPPPQVCGPRRTMCQSCETSSVHTIPFVNSSIDNTDCTYKTSVYTSRPLFFELPSQLVEGLLF